MAAKPQPKPQPKPVEKPQPQQVAQTPPPAKTQPQPQQQQAAIPAPTGKAYVVQLGALKNADKVNEIVGKLRSSGFKAGHRHPRRFRVKLPVFWWGRMRRKTS